MKKTILLCALFTSLIAKAQVPGTLDSSFADNGILRWTVTSGISTTALELKLLPDGKLLVGGAVNGANIDMLVARFKANGTPDSSMQGTGFSMLDPLLGADDNTYCMELLSDGKILIGGYQQGVNDNDMIVYKLNADGTIDNTWGNNGKVMVDAGGYESAMKIKAMPDGKILIGCTKYGNNSSNMFIVRLLADGTLDNTFSNDGISPVIFIGQTQGNFVDMELLPGGNIIVCGTISDGVLAQIGMAKLNNAGQGLPVFGVSSKYKFAMDGKSTQPFNMILTSKNKLLISAAYAKANNDASGVLLMVDTSGVADNTFGSGKGVIAYDNTNLAEDEKFVDLMEMKNGDFFVLSSYEDVNSNDYIQGIVFDGTGNVRISFGKNGVIQFYGDASYTIVGLRGIVPQPDGKILILSNAKNQATNKVEALVYRLNLENKATSGIVGINNKSAIKIYPNPSTGSFSIAGNAKVENVWMYDVAGKLVATWNNNQVYTIPENAVNGLYYIKVQSAEGINIQPLNINR